VAAAIERVGAFGEAREPNIRHFGEAREPNIRQFGRLLPAALAVARTATKHTVDFDWGPLLQAAFAAGAPAAGPLSDPQRRYLAELVDNADLWDPRHGNASLAFKQAGLPYDRDACRALLDPHAGTGGRARRDS
jgi:hypothetical protein